MTAPHTEPLVYRKYRVDIDHGGVTEGRLAHTFKELEHLLTEHLRQGRTVTVSEQYLEDQGAGPAVGGRLRTPCEYLDVLIGTVSGAQHALTVHPDGTLDRAANADRSARALDFQGRARAAQRRRDDQAAQGLIREAGALITDLRGDVTARLADLDASHPARDALTWSALFTEHRLLELQVRTS